MITRRDFIQLAATFAILSGRVTAQAGRGSSGVERRRPGVGEIKLTHGSQQEAATRDGSSRRQSSSTRP